MNSRNLVRIFFNHSKCWDPNSATRRKIIFPMDQCTYMRQASSRHQSANILDALGWVTTTTIRALALQTESSAKIAIFGTSPASNGRQRFLDIKNPNCNRNWNIATSCWWRRRQTSNIFYLDFYCHMSCKHLCKCFLIVSTFVYQLLFTYYI